MIRSRLLRKGITTSNVTLRRQELLIIRFHCTEERAKENWLTIEQVAPEYKRRRLEEEKGIKEAGTRNPRGGWEE